MVFSNKIKPMILEYTDDKSYSITWWRTWGWGGGGPGLFMTGLVSRRTAGNHMMFLWGLQWTPRPVFVELNFVHVWGFLQYLDKIPAKTHWTHKLSLYSIPCIRHSGCVENSLHYMYCNFSFKRFFVCNKSAKM